MKAERIVPLLFVVTATAACGLTEQPTVNTAELLLETQEVVLGLRDELASFQDQIDSLRLELSRQDSLLRHLANLQGMPMPPKPVALDPPR